MAKQNKVCVNLDQSNEQNGGFSDAEKLQARNNIGASDGKIPLETELATHSSILAWKIPWIEEPG